MKVRQGQQNLVHQMIRLYDIFPMIGSFLADAGVLDNKHHERRLGMGSIGEAFEVSREVPAIIVVYTH